MDIPLGLTAGDLWSWTDSLSDYPAPSWVLTYYFRGPSTFSVAASASGANHVSSVAAATTTTYKPGEYSWQARVANGSTKVTVDSGRLSVLPDLSNAAVDHRSFNQRALESLQAVIENRATTDQLAFSIAGRSVSRMNWDEILAAYDHFRLKVAAETGTHPGRVFIRTGRA